MLARLRRVSAWWDAGWAVGVLVGLGAALRLWQYLGNAGLWLDELAVADNVIGRSLWVLLTQPLADGQVAPPGFIIVSRAMVVAFGPNEYALRLFPLLCSLGALLLFARIATRVLREPGAVLAVALFALTPVVALYAAEAKQYATDLLVTLGLTELVLRWLEQPTRRRTVALAGFGAIAPFFSQPAVFVAAGLAAALLLGAPRGERRRLLPPLALWAVAAGASVVYARARMSSGLMAYMQWFWRDGFLPRPVKSLEDALWPARALRDVFALLLGYPWAWAYLALAGWGLVSLLRRARVSALVVVFPVAVTLLAAIVHSYPFQLRVVLFVVPALLLLVAEGVGSLAELVRTRVAVVLLSLAVAGPVLVDLWRSPPMWRLDEVRPVLAELQRRRQPGDAVYAYYPTWQAIRFYGPRYGLGFDAIDLGACHPQDVRDYLRELDRYRGRRVWFLSAFPLARLGEKQAMLGYLDAIGTREDAIEGPPTTRPGAITTREQWTGRPPPAAYLYDLSDAKRLEAASADTARVPAAVQLVGVPRCVYGPVVPHVPTVGQSIDSSARPESTR
jgi:hypothetical protein